MKNLPDWRVIRCSMNDKKMIAYNVFSHGGFFKDVCSIVADYRRAISSNPPGSFHINKWDEKLYSYVPVTLTPREYLSYKLRGSAMYYFWSKCEWEIILSSWPPGACEHKIDVFAQLRINWETFVDYVIAHAKDFPMTKSAIQRAMNAYTSAQREGDLYGYHF